jgi:hypothetical protein
MAMDDLGHETVGSRESFAARMARLRALKSGGNGKGFLGGIERRIRGLETWQLVLGGAVVVLVGDHLIAPKGMSFASKMMDKLGVGKAPALPPPPPPPALSPAAIAAKGDYAGANLQAGWNRGMSPYGPWAVANPMVQYAHAAQRQHQWATSEPWAFAAEYPWSY